MEKKKRVAVYDLEAQRRWKEKNKERVKHLRNKSKARCFIRDEATIEDLEELEEVLQKRKSDLGVK